MEKYSLYGSFTAEEARAVGKTFKARCTANYGYEGHLTDAKVYEIEITPRILELTPLCKLIGDMGKEVECHLARFDKLQEPEIHSKY